MSCSFLFFISRVGLAEEFFRTTAEAVVLTRSEFACMTQLSRKGYFAPADVKRWVKDGKIRQAETGPTKATAPGEEYQRTVETYHRIKAKFIITEDDFLRGKLQEAGLNVLSTPGIIGHMAKKGVISKERASEALETLKVFGWHKSAVLDQIKEAIQRD